MTERPRPFRYHAVELESGAVLGTYPSQHDATRAVLEAGESVSLEPGEVKVYAVRVEAIATGETYDIPLEVGKPT
jgi:hypothetical protein